MIDHPLDRMGYVNKNKASREQVEIHKTKIYVMYYNGPASQRTISFCFVLFCFVLNQHRANVGPHAVIALAKMVIYILKRH